MKCAVISKLPATVVRRSCLPSQVFLDRDLSKISGYVNPTIGTEKLAAFMERYLYAFRRRKFGAEHATLRGL